MRADPLRYLLYGLQVESTRPLPGLRPLAADDGDVDVRFAFEDSQSIEPGGLRGPVVSESTVVTIRSLSEGAWTALCYADGDSFLLDREGTEVRIFRGRSSPTEDVFRLLLGSVTGLLLRRRGLQCIHAGVVERDHRALALIAPSGSGKSTLGAALLEAGFALVSDDVLALRETEEGFLALPGTARVRLWQDAADALLGDEAQSMPLGHSRPKRLWDLTRDAKRVRAGPCRLAAVYHLLPGADAPGQPSVEPHEGADLLVALLANTYPNPEHYPLEPEHRAREFQVLGRLVEQVPLRKVLYRRELESIPALRRAIVEDFDSLAGRIP